MVPWHDHLKVNRFLSLILLKRNHPWIFIGWTDAEAEAPIFWPPDAKNWLIGTDSDVGKHWRQEEKGTTEDEMVGWHHGLSGHEFEKVPGDSEGHGSLVGLPRVGHSLLTEQQEREKKKREREKMTLFLSQVPVCVFNHTSSSHPWDGHSAQWPWLMQICRSSSNKYWERNLLHVPNVNSGWCRQERI